MADRTRDMILTGLKEGVKRHIVLKDPGVDNRIKFVYEAPVDWENGKPCLKSSYGYYSTTAIVVDMREEISAWDSAWDSWTP